MQNRPNEAHRALRRETEPARTPLSALAKPEIRVALVTAIALVLQAVLAKNVFEVELDYGSQFAALWVFIVFLITGDRGRFAELGTIVTIVVVTASVLALYTVW